MRASTRAQNEHPHASLSGSALRSHAFALSLLSTASAPRCRLRLRRQQHCCQNDRHSRGAATAAAAALPRTATATRHRPGPPFSAPTALPPPPPQLPPPGEQSRGATAGTIVCFLNLPHSPCPKLPHMTLMPPAEARRRPAARQRRWRRVRIRIWLRWTAAAASVAGRSHQRWVDTSFNAAWATGIRYSASSHCFSVAAIFRDRSLSSAHLQCPFPRQTQLNLRSW